jgi:hypothetical protein
MAAALGYAGYIQLRGKQPATPRHVNQELKDLAAVVPPLGRMLVILLDSARMVDMFGPHMPFTSGLRQRGAWGISRVVSTPLTFACDRAIFSGVVDNQLTVYFDNIRVFPSTEDSLLRRVARQGGRVVVFGDHLKTLYGGEIGSPSFQPRNYRINQYKEEAEETFRDAYQLLKTERWDLAVVPFYAIDYIGHLETPRSPKLVPILNLMDEYIRQILNLTTEQDVVLITSEHGIDDDGLHTWNSTNPTANILETPFVLTGPNVKRGGPKELLQIDWAPTLSLLAGVSPLYESPALPAIDLLEVSPEATSLVLRVFSSHITGSPTLGPLDDLRSKRLALAGRGSLRPGISVVAVLTILAMALLAYVALFSADRDRNVTHGVLKICTGMVGLFSLIGTAFYFGVIDNVARRLPFSANFILSHPFMVALALGCIAAFAMLLHRPRGTKSPAVDKELLVFLFSLVFAAIFLSDRPYDPLAWVLLSIPLLGWGRTRRPAWLGVFGAIIMGLLIRRLTTYALLEHTWVPERWHIAVALYAGVLVFQGWRLRTAELSRPTLVFGTALFLPGVILMGRPFSIEVQTLLFLLGLAPVVALGNLDDQAKEVWWALWVVFFYLGTSSHINFAAQVAAFPLLLSVWAAAKDSSSVTRGVVVGMAIWVLYILPGNRFDLRLGELRDPYILGHLVFEHIELTVMVIASRHIMPAIVLVWGVQSKEPRRPLLSMTSTVMLPVVCGIGGLTVFWISAPALGLHWARMIRLPVLLGYYVTVICASFLVVALSGLYKLFRPSAT